MSKIQERLDSLQPYIVGIRYIQGMQIVDAVFKEGWTVPTSDIIKQEFVDESQNYYMFFTEKEGITIDNLLEYVEGIININIEREKKYDLLKKKVEELKRLFKDNPLTKLERLKFSFSERDIIPSLGDMDINLDDDDDDAATDAATDAASDAVKPEPVEIDKVKKNSEKLNKTTRVTNVKGQNVELPPKGSPEKSTEKIVVEEFKPPTNITCKCGPDDVCPVCEEEKIGTY